MPTMLVTRIPFWRLRQHGVVEEAVRGGSRRRIVGRDWPLPEPVRERMRGLLAPLGFDLVRPILVAEPEDENALEFRQDDGGDGDRKSTRLNSSHLVISYAVFCLKKKKNKHTLTRPTQHKKTIYK